MPCNLIHPVRLIDYNDNVYIELNAMFDEDLYTLKVDKVDYDYEKEGE